MSLQPFDDRLLNQFWTPLPRAGSSDLEFVDGCALAGRGDGNNWYEHFRAHPRRVEDCDKVLKSNSAYVETLLDVLPKDAVVAEFGCGPAVRLLTLLSRFPRRVCLVDRDPRILALARQNASALRVFGASYFRGDINSPAIYRDLPKFNVASHHGVLEHYSQPQIRRVLLLQLEHAEFVVFTVPLLTSHNEGLYHGDGIHRNLWTSEVWRDQILKGFFIDSIREVRTNKDELVVRLTSLGGGNDPREFAAR